MSANRVDSFRFAAPQAAVAPQAAFAPGQDRVLASLRYMEAPSLLSQVR